MEGHHNFHMHAEFGMFFLERELGFIFVNSEKSTGCVILFKGFHFMFMNPPGLSSNS